MTAIVPAAGLGTRMDSITGGAPKELLTVGGQVILERVLDEALTFASEVVVVSSPTKPEIDEFLRLFGSNRVRVTYQDNPNGLADAVLRGSDSDSAAAVLLADVFFEPCSPLARLAENLVDNHCWACVAVRKVPREETGAYGVVAFGDDGLVTQVVEKPDPKNAPSDWVVAGRFVLSAEAFTSLISVVSHIPNATLSELLQEGVNIGKRVLALPLEEDERLFDCGAPAGYEAAMMELGA